MGDAAEAALDGSVCEQCGEWMEDVIGGAEPPGYPRTCEACGGDPEDESPGFVLALLGAENLLRAVLLFHDPGPWTDTKRALWQELTGAEEATAKSLCDAIRDFLSDEPEESTDG